MECIEQHALRIPFIRTPAVKNSGMEGTAALELYVRNPEKRLEKQEPFERTKSVQELSSIYPRSLKESSCNGSSCKTFHVTRFNLTLSEIFQKNIFASAVIIIVGSLLAQAIM